MSFKFTSQENVTVPSTTTTPADRAVCRKIKIDLDATGKSSFTWDRGVEDGVVGGDLASKVDSVVMELDNADLITMLDGLTLDGEKLSDALDRILAAKAVALSLLPAGSHEDAP